MVDKTEISNPIQIKDKSVERVAFDLMERIARAETPNTGMLTAEQKKRDYWLKLYNQCHRTVNSSSANVKVILEDDFS